MMMEFADNGRNELFAKVNIEDEPRTMRIKFRYTGCPSWNT